jgi:hypothetical protein
VSGGERVFVSYAYLRGRNASTAVLARVLGHQALAQYATGTPEQEHISRNQPAAHATVFDSVDE